MFVLARLVLVILALTSVTPSLLVLGGNAPTPAVYHACQVAHLKDLNINGVPAYQFGDPITIPFVKSAPTSDGKGSIYAARDQGMLVSVVTNPDTGKVYLQNKMNSTGRKFVYKLQHSVAKKGITGFREEWYYLFDNASCQLGGNTGDPAFVFVQEIKPKKTRALL